MDSKRFILSLSNAFLFLGFALLVQVGLSQEEDRIFPFEFLDTSSHLNSVGSRDSFSIDIDTLPTLPPVVTDLPGLSSNTFSSFSSGSNDLSIQGSSSNSPRMILRVEDGTSSCKTCGGFSNEVSGQCCQACGRLNYKSCWCRSCDCLCY